jgi:dihydrofolate reductase
MTLQMTDVSAKHFRGIVDNSSALVVGQRLFDLTSAWGGTHPMNRPVVVLTHNVPQGWPHKSPITFVTDGIEAAVDTAKQLAGDKVVGVNGGSIARQCLNPRPARRDLGRPGAVLLGGGVLFGIR